MAEPKNKPERRNPKPKRKSIPDTFQISKPQPHPVRLILEPSAYEHPDADPNPVSRHEVQLGVYTPNPVSRNLDTVPTKMSRNLDTGLNPLDTGLKPVSKPTSHPVSRHKVKLRNPNEGQVAFWINKDLLKQIEHLCLEMSISKKEFFERVSRHAVENMSSPLVQSFQDLVSRNLDHDDMMRWKTCEDVIMAFQNFSGQKWSYRDDKHGHRYNDADIRVVEIAIVRCIERKLNGNTGDRPVKSFAYFTEEIDFTLQEVRAGTFPAPVDAYHKYALEVWGKRILPLRQKKWGI